jgi:hypothetical protein
MVTEQASLMTNAADTFEVIVLLSRDEGSEASIPLGPEALGYLTATSDGYVFVRCPQPESDIVQAERNPACWTLQVEESCF